MGVWGRLAGDCWEKRGGIYRWANLFKGMSEGRVKGGDWFIGFWQVGVVLQGAMVL